VVAGAVTGAGDRRMERSAGKIEEPILFYRKDPMITMIWDKNVS
jgi:hypothetical protein